MKNAADGPIDQLVKARWLAIGLSQTDLAEVLDAAFKQTQRDGSGSNDGAAARLIGFASLTHDFVDVYASREHPTPYAFEERFVRETSVAKIIAPTIKAALSDAGTFLDSASSLSRSAFA